VNLILAILAVALTLALGLISFVQLLYLEALRFRAREQPALEFFKDTLEDRLGLRTDQGALAFSLLKHFVMVLLGLVFCGLTADGGTLDWKALAEAAGAGLVVMMTAAHIVPQWLYCKTSGKWLLPLAPPLRLLALAVRPLTGFFAFLRSLATLNETSGPAVTNGNSSEDLEALIEAGADEGLIEEDDRKLIQSVVELGDKTVREVMTPRPNIVATSLNTSIEEFRKLAINSHFSRIPVYRESIDDIVGFVHVRDILKLESEERGKHELKEFVRPTQFVPETKPVAELFREMQQENVHMAVVVDEYGQTAGIATMEDVVEEVFGEIRDEYDPSADLKEEADGVYLVSGSVDLDRLDDLLDFRPREETESTTVGGLITEWLGHVPAVGEVAEQDGIRIEVTAGDERHVKQVRVSRSGTGEWDDGGGNGKSEK